MTYLIDSTVDKVEKDIAFNILKHAIGGKSNCRDNSTMVRSKVSTKNMKLWQHRSSIPEELPSPESVRPDLGQPNRKITLSATDTRIIISLEIVVDNEYTELYIEANSLKRVVICVVPESRSSRKHREEADPNSAGEFKFSLFFDTKSKPLNAFRTVLRSAVLNHMSPAEQHWFKSLTLASRIDFKATCRPAHIVDAFDVAFSHQSRSPGGPGISHFERHQRQLGPEILPVEHHHDHDRHRGRRGRRDDDYYVHRTPQPSTSTSKPRKSRSRHGICDCHHSACRPTGLDGSSSLAGLSGSGLGRTNSSPGGAWDSWSHRATYGSYTPKTDSYPCTVHEYLRRMNLQYDQECLI